MLRSWGRRAGLSGPFVFPKGVENVIFPFICPKKRRTCVFSGYFPQNASKMWFFPPAHIKKPHVCMYLNRILKNFLVYSSATPPTHTPSCIPMYSPCVSLLCPLHNLYALPHTHDPINIANPILGGKIVAKDVVKDSIKVQRVQRKQVIIQIHFLG